MCQVLKRDSSLHWCSDLTTAVSEEMLLIAKDGSEVSIPTITLLAASPVIRSMVSDIVKFSPLALSLTGVSRSVLVCVSKILGTGEVNVNKDIREEVMMAMKMLGVRVSLNFFQIENLGAGIMEDNQEKEQNNMGKDKINLNEEKLEISDKLDDCVKSEPGEYVEHVKRESGKYDDNGFESTYEGGEVKDEKSVEGKENCELRETETNNYNISGIRKEGEETGHERKNTILGIVNRVMSELRFECFELGETKVDSGGRKRKPNPRKRKRNDHDIDVHFEVTCNGCEVRPIIGERHRCTVCRNYDLCGSCKEKGTHSETGHTMNKVSLFKCNLCNYRSSKRGNCNICEQDDEGYTPANVTI